MIGFLYVGVLKCTYSLPQIETRKSLTLSFSLNKTKQQSAQKNKIVSNLIIHTNLPNNEYERTLRTLFMKWKKKNQSTAFWFGLSAFETS